MSNRIHGRCWVCTLPPPTPLSPPSLHFSVACGCDGRLMAVQLLRSSNTRSPQPRHLSLRPFLKRRLADKFTAIWSAYRMWIWKLMAKAWGENLFCLLENLQVPPADVYIFPPFSFLPLSGSLRLSHRVTCLQAASFKRDPIFLLRRQTSEVSFVCLKYLRSVVFFPLLLKAAKGVRGTGRIWCLLVTAAISQKTGGSVGAS